jgi:hypothetical protein
MVAILIEEILIEFMGVSKSYLLDSERKENLKRIYVAFKKYKTARRCKEYLYNSISNEHLTERNKDYIWQKYQAVRQEETLYSLGELHIENVRMLYSHVSTNAHGV